MPNLTAFLEIDFSEKYNDKNRDNQIKNEKMLLPEVNITSLYDFKSFQL